MTDIEFIDICKNEVVKYANDHLDKTDGRCINSDDVYAVWLTKVLQNNKFYYQVHCLMVCITD